MGGSGRGSSWAWAVDPKGDEAPDTEHDAGAQSPRPKGVRRKAGDPRGIGRGLGSVFRNLLGRVADGFGCFADVAEEGAELEFAELAKLARLVVDGERGREIGRVVSEVGAVLIVGGNIDHLTRVMTTAIALETSKGDLALALALGIILVAISLALNAAAHGVQSRTEATLHG